MLMAKKKSLFKNIPRSFLAIGFVSLALNAIFIGIIVVGNVLETTGSFDYATANAGIERMCSKDFRQKVERDAKAQGDSENQQKLKVALVDFPCSNNGAEKYYQDGFKAYARSLGVNP